MLRMQLLMRAMRGGLSVKGSVELSLFVGHIILFDNFGSTRGYVRSRVPFQHRKMTCDFNEEEYDLISSMSYQFDTSSGTLGLYTLWVMISCPEKLNADDPTYSLSAVCKYRISNIGPHLRDTTASCPINAL